MIDLEPFRDQIEAVAKTEYGRVVGSVGRMATFSAELNDPYAEFNARTAERLSGIPSDLDVIGLTPEQLEEIRRLNPQVKVDDAAFNADDLRVRPLEDGDWMLTSDVANFRSLLPKAYFEKTTVEVSGIEIATIPISTHSFLHFLKPRERKDQIAANLIVRAMSRNNILPTILQRNISTTFYRDYARVRGTEKSKNYRSSSPS